MPNLLYLHQLGLTGLLSSEKSFGKSGPEFGGKVLMVLVIIRMCGNGASFNQS